MRHGMSTRKLNRTANQRKALLKGLANSLIKEEHIVTTLPKAKELRPIVERFVTTARKYHHSNGSVPFSSVYRFLYASLGLAETCGKLLEVLGKRYLERQGGYVRIVKAGYRHGDNAPMAVIEFVEA